MSFNLNQIDDPNGGGSGPPPAQPPGRGTDQNSERVPARIHQINFKYEDPGVNVTREQNTVEHETIDDQVVVQTLGEQAAQITVNAIVTEYETTFIDILTFIGPVTLRTERYSGTVVVTSVDTEYRREKDAEGSWLYDATIECLEA